MNLLLFVLAAAFGGFLRFTFEYYLPPVGSSAFPRATLLVNVVGAFLLGIVLALPGELQVILVWHLQHRRFLESSLIYWL